ncbi:2-hydroxyacid dehydrogenase [Staphylococcus massiliensis]|uniref:Glyoxylate reductase n=1 Tax=Staphylococcus massiliensis S46 TaxID=1229783 RepID=K9AKZ5_9STAP|nr:D-glycerate dehydrogenase [Staphylococcus massiliensis]EKU48023.1 glyoxylate reductase [Staphylococcus massiliensis S46]POA00087.1 D-glycerate dehydrogenase [Staphylococcus massiliensis CCUG 55927]
MTKVLITRKIPDRFVNDLEQFAEVEMWPHDLTPMPRDQFLASIKDATACITTLSETIDETVLSQAPHLKVIVNMAVGYDNINLELTRTHNVVVTNTPHVLSETTAELGFSLMLAVARRIVEAEKYVKDGKWQSWGPYLFAGKDVFQSKVGIFGMGEIGQAFARRLQGFHSDVLYHNRSRNLKAEKTLGVHYTDFDTLISESDFVICTAPLTQETERRFNKDVFKKMKRDAIFINIGRGPIVVEKDLVEALKQGEILGAGLDVVTEEPIDMNHEFLKLDNVVVVPHIGSATVVTRNRMIQCCVENVKAILNDKPPKTPVEL